MKDSNILVRRYTNTLYSLALEKKAVKGTYKLLKTMLDAVNSLELIKNVALSQKAPIKVKKEAWDLILNAFKASTLIKNFIQLLIENDKIHLFSKIVDKYNEVLLENMGIKTVKIITSSILTTIQKNKIIKHLEKILSKKINLVTTIDKSLLGGMILKFDSYMLDASIKSKLNYIKSTLLSQGV